jgi:hypothetical protein
VGDDVMQPEVGTGMGCGTNPKRIIVRRTVVCVLCSRSSSLTLRGACQDYKTLAVRTFSGPCGRCRGAIAAVGSEDRDGGLK